MKEYTIAVVFSKNGREVLLQLKNRPKWQEGKWNFPGGKVEPNEVPMECVIREFKEECGLHIDESRWNYVGIFSGIDEAFPTLEYTVHVFVTQVVEGENPFANEDQPVYWFLNNSLPDSVIPNLRWIIPLILNKVKFFNIEYLP